MINKIFSDEAVLAELTEILVYPSYEDIKKLEMLGSKRQLGKMFGAHYRTKIKGMEQISLVLENFNRRSIKICPLGCSWKNRRRKIMVREFESETKYQSNIIIGLICINGRRITQEYKIRICD